MKMLRYIVALTATVALVACDLNEHPDYFTNRAEMFRSEGQCRAAVNSCYLNIDPIYSSRMFQITEGCVDTGLTWATTLDPVLDISPAYPRHGSTIWEQCYKGVMRCNYAVEGLESSTIDNKELDVVVRGSGNAAESLDALRSMPISRPRSSAIRLRR